MEEEDRREESIMEGKIEDKGGEGRGKGRGRAYKSMQIKRDRASYEIRISSDVPFGRDRVSLGRWIMQSKNIHGTSVVKREGSEGEGSEGDRS